MQTSIRPRIITMKGENDPGKQSFPYKLFKMLDIAEKEGFQHIISWTEDGRAFTLRDRTLFEKQILRRFFVKQGKHRSFTRQLNFYSFQRDGKTFWHPSFRKGQKCMLQFITRIELKGASRKIDGITFNLREISGNKNEVGNLMAAMERNEGNLGSNESIKNGKAPIYSSQFCSDTLTGCQKAVGNQELVQNSTRKFNYTNQINSTQNRDTITTKFNLLSRQLLDEGLLARKYSKLPIGELNEGYSSRIANIRHPFQLPSRLVSVANPKRILPNLYHHGDDEYITADFSKPVGDLQGWKSNANSLAKNPERDTHRLSHKICEKEMKGDMKNAIYVPLDSLNLFRYDDHDDTLPYSITEV